MAGTMVRADLERLVSESKGEWEHIEFKKTTGELQGAMETLCGFLNGSGGRVFFGITNSGAILGQDMTDPTFQEVANAIRKIEPPVWINQIRVPISAGKEVLILEVSVQAEGPYIYDGRPYVRIGNTTSRMPQIDYERRLLARSHAEQRWEHQIAEGYVITDLDLPEIMRMLNSAVYQGRIEEMPGSPEETLDRLHLRVDGRLLRAAVVLFGKRFLPFYPQCGLRMARFKGCTKNEFLDQRQLNGNAFELLDEAMKFLMRHIPVAGRLEPGQMERQDTPLYPPVALREALVNALCHRNYAIPGGAVNIAVFDDRLEVISSGLLPEGIRVADLKRNHISRPRNPLIAEVFFRRGLIERWGRGTQKIVEECLAAGQAEPEFEEQSGDLVVRFRPGSYHPPLQVRYDLSDRQRQILMILSDGNKWRLGDILEKLSSATAPRTLRDDLQFLKKADMVESGGRSVAARWWLKQVGSEKGGEERRTAEKGGEGRRKA